MLRMELYSVLCTLYSLFTELITNYRHSLRSGSRAEGRSRKRVSSHRQ